MYRQQGAITRDLCPLYGLFRPRGPVSLPGEAQDVRARPGFDDDLDLLRLAVGYYFERTGERNQKGPRKNHPAGPLFAPLTRTVLVIATLICGPQ